MRIGFVVLTWNSAQYIENCISSILDTELETEIVVVDNGSTDNTLAVLDKYEDKETPIVSIRLDNNKGTTVTRNMAIKTLKPFVDYICILDSDTVVNKDAFEVMLATLKSDSSIGVIGPTMVSTAGTEQLSGRNLPTLGIKIGKALKRSSSASAEVPDAPIINGIQDVGYLLSACWLIPVEVFDKVGLLDEAIFYAPEDVDWCVRCHQNGYRVVKCCNATIIHEYQRIGHKKLLSKANWEHIKGLVYYFKKYRYFFKEPF